MNLASSVANLMISAQDGDVKGVAVAAAFVALDVLSLEKGKALATGAKAVAREGFSSFNAFKKVYGAAEKGSAWHHIVEQGGNNVSRFGAETIHNVNNIIELPHGAGSIHAKVSGYYSSKQAFSGGQTVRQWLSTQDYQQQYDFGIKVMKQFGWTK